MWKNGGGKEKEIKGEENLRNVFRNGKRISNVV